MALKVVTASAGIDTIRFALGLSSKERQEMESELIPLLQEHVPETRGIWVEAIDVRSMRNAEEVRHLMGHPGHFPENLAMLSQADHLWHVLRDMRIAMETAREKRLDLFLCFYCTAGIHRSEAACYFA
eukprot:4343378-Amphidinium_carterae.1